MKSTIMILLCAVLIGNSALAQKIAADKVPSSVLSSFKTKFSSAEKANWELESATEYEVNFKIENEEHSATFDPSGKWLKTETEIKISDLPKAVSQTISNQFPSSKIKEAEKAETADKGLLYEVELKVDKEIYKVQLSPSGEVLKKEIEKEDKED